MNKTIDAKLEYDLDKNGTLSDEELTTSTNLIELELREEKARTQKKISWTSLLSTLVVVALLMTPLVSVERVAALADLLGLFFIANASIIGFYFGATAYMTRT